MKKFTLFSTALVLLVALLFQTACVKEGPVGPAGTTGAQGAQGVQGVQGTNGKDATVVSKVFTFQYSDWVKKPNGTPGEYDYKIVVDFPSITQAVVDRGLVVAYVSNGGGGYIAMPYSYGYESGGSTYVIDYQAVHYLGGITFWRGESDGMPTVSTLEPTKSFKIVVIPPSGLAAHPDVDFKDYNKVVETFNLND